MVQNQEKKICLGPQKSLFSLSTAQAEKNSWKKVGKTRLVIWWFDVMNKIYYEGFIFLEFIFKESQLFIFSDLQ